MCVVRRYYEDVFAIENRQSQAWVLRQNREFDRLLGANPFDYNIWYEYVQHIQSLNPRNHDMVRRAYELAISNVPLDITIDRWSSYIEIWFKYATFEERVSDNMEQARDVYIRCLSTVPDTRIPIIRKVKIMYAEFEYRINNGVVARSIFEQAIADHPHEDLFDAYIGMEQYECKWDKCRTLFRRYINKWPKNLQIRIQFAQMEYAANQPQNVMDIFKDALNNIEKDDLGELQKEFGVFWALQNKIWLYPRSRQRLSEQN